MTLLVVVAAGAVVVAAVAVVTGVATEGDGVVV